MNEETKKIIKKIVNRGYSCSKCKDRIYCRYGKGGMIASACLGGECSADIYAEGAYAMLKHLANIQWNEAMEAICRAGKEEQP